MKDQLRKKAMLNVAIAQDLAEEFGGRVFTYLSRLNNKLRRIVVMMIQTETLFVSEWVEQSTLCEDSVGGQCLLTCGACEYASCPGKEGIEQYVLDNLVSA